MSRETRPDIGSKLWSQRRKRCRVRCKNHLTPASAWDSWNRRILPISANEQALVNVVPENNRLLTITSFFSLACPISGIYSRKGRNMATRQEVGLKWESWRKSQLQSILLEWKTGLRLMVTYLIYTSVICLLYSLGYSVFAVYHG